MPSEADNDDSVDKLIVKLDKAEAKAHNNKLEVDRLKRKLAKVEREYETKQSAYELERRVVSAQDLEVPKWNLPVDKKDGKSHAWAVQMFNDLHLDEVQTMEEVGRYNSYNRKIAEMRLMHTAQSSIKYLKKYTAGIEFDGICLPFAGDIITGEIHEELTKTNEAPIPDTIKFWAPRLAAMIELYLKTFPKVPGGIFVPCVPGNHDRRGKQMEHKNAAMDSYSWIIYHWLADRFRNDPRVTFYIPNSLDARFNLYDTRFLLTHGYGMSGGGASGGLGALMSDRQRTAVRDAVIGADFDWLLCGHLHQTIFGQGAIMSGCMKGFDTYAYDIKCKPEPPSQALFLVTPERSVTMRMPVFCEAPGERKYWK